MQATKWLKLPLFLSREEIRSLLTALGKIHIVPLSGVFREGMEELSPQSYEDLYSSYLESLCRGEPASPDKKLISAWTLNLDSIEVIQVASGALVKPKLPVVQVQPFWLNYSTTDGKFHEMAFSRESLAWGLQFSFPQLFQEPAHLEILKVQEPEFPNAGLFKNIQRFSRASTVPTPFMLPDGSKLNHPCRIGKSLLSKASEMPQLVNKGLKLCL
jgi:hypothetical protein